MRRLTIVVVVLGILAGGIAAAAVADHRHKNAPMGPANVASWYCHNRNQRCQEPQSETIEASWQEREKLYRLSFCVVSRCHDGARPQTPRLAECSYVSLCGQPRECSACAVPTCGMRP